MCYSILVEQDLKHLELTFDALIDHKAFERYEKMNNRDSKKYKSIAANPRIYPNYFAPIITMKQEQRVITPMRYRIRPAGSNQEVPTKYNMFNARVDSLLSRKSWKTLIMRNHGVVGLKSFYEWVVGDDGRKKVIEFTPDSGKILAVPIIYDTWIAPDQSEGFASFAVITRDPPSEVLEAGHDRSPIILPKGSINGWLNPDQNTKSLLESLDQPPEETFHWLDSTP